MLQITQLEPPSRISVFANPVHLQSLVHVSLHYFQPNSLLSTMIPLMNLYNKNKFNMLIILDLYVISDN